MQKNRRLSFAVRILLLAVFGLSSTACYFDGHWGHCHRPRVFVPVRVCR